MTSRLKLFGLAAAALLLFFYGTASMPLWSTDEGRHAEIGREMLETGNYVIPQYQYVDYLEKPVFAFALTALSYRLAGVNELGARLVSILSALFGILLLYFFSRRLFNPGAAFFSAMMLMTTVGYVLVGRFAVIDMLMTFLLSASLFCLMAGYFEKKSGWYLLSYFLMGLSVVTKGLIGVLLPGLIMGLFLLFRRDLKEILKMHVLPGILIVAVIVLPWWIAATKQKPEFFQVFILEHHFGRFATKQFGRTKPFWFFAPVLLGACFPWSFFLPSAVKNVFQSKGEERDKLFFLFLWAAVIFVFFSIPKSKLPYYLLPLSMPVALLSAVLFQKSAETLQSDRWLKISWQVLRVLGFLGLPAAAIAFFLRIKDPSFQALRPLLFAAGGLLTAGLLGSSALFCRGKIQAGITALSAMVFAAMLLTASGMQKITPIQSAYDEAQIILKERKPGDQVVLQASPDDFSDLTFYLKQRPIIAGSDRGTLARESMQSDPEGKWFWSMARLGENFNRRDRRLFVLTYAKRLKDLEANGIKSYRVLTQRNGKILIDNAV